MAKLKNKSPKKFPSSGGVAEGRGGHVPRLRFPEFRSQDSWPALTMNEISTRITEKVGSEKLTPVSITAGKGFVAQTEKFGRDISGDQYKNYVLLREGEFAYNKGNSKKYAQGCIYKLKEFKKVAAPYAYISFRLNDGYEPDFFQFYFEMNAHGKQLQKYITSGARSDGLLNIDPDNFFRISLPTPSFPEQQRIADCLTSLDEVISAESQKLDALKAHKKGLMQKLFPAEGETVPRLRFPEFRDSEKWEEKSLGDAATFYNGRAYKQEELLAEGRYRVLRVGNFFSSKHWYYSNLELESDKYCENGDLLYAWSASFGPRIWVGEKTIYHYHIWKVVQKREIDKNFLFIILDYETEKVKAKSANGLGMMHITKGTIEAWKCRFPNLSEQQRIANCLSSLDDLIAAQAEKIAALKVQKKGLMQGLFPAAGE